MDIVKKVKQFVESECKKPTSKYGYEPFVYHFLPMLKYAKDLSEKYKADREIVLLSVWLHDIGSIICGRENHHITGSRIAEEKLKELDYSKERIKLIKNCILHHRGSRNEKMKTIEEKIVAEADAMSAFDNISGIFKAAFVYEKLDQGEAKRKVRKKFENKWKQLSPIAKKIIKKKYDAIMYILKD
ncbi:MAG: HD domain-containing protein [Patescibacteria group bacterium]|nr:HD domain-containing protein [Patescibacteria group bacterium]MDD4304122.1 HD domain-containing protein [Patescibacteria group bacterium]MDD4695153.1 HD domain-containing protein [Patescibacteria group bacterium]